MDNIKDKIQIKEYKALINIIPMPIPSNKYATFIFFIYISPILFNSFNNI